MTKGLFVVGFLIPKDSDSILAASPAWLSQASWEEAICSQVRNQHIMYYGTMRRQSPIDP